MHEITAKRWARTALIAWLTATLLATGLLALSPSNAYAAAKKAPKLSATSKTVLKGKTFTLKVKNAGKAKVKWTSSNKKVATVSKTGKVTAKKAGKATITAKVGKKKLTCKVTVKGLTKAQKAKRSLNGWWHTWSSGGHYMYIKDGKAYLFLAHFDDSSGTFVASPSNVTKAKIALTRTKTSPGSSEKRPGYRVRVDKSTYYYYDDDHRILENRYGKGYLGYSGSSSMDKLKSSDVPANLRKYVKWL